jgi:Spy/CpxP family protein refolding chaperone
MSAIDAEPVKRPPSRVKWMAVSIVIAVFFTGVFVGVIGDHIFLVLHRQFVPPLSWMAHITPRIVKQLDRHLDLTPEQETRVRGILDRHHQRIQQLSAQARSGVQGEIRAANGEIEAVLTPAQRAKFSKMKMHLLSHHGAE